MANGIANGKDASIYLGGNAVVKGNVDSDENVEANVEASDDTHINIGQGQTIEGVKVAKPVDGFNVGVTYSSTHEGSVKFTNEDTTIPSSYAKYFTSDNPNWYVVHNNAGYLGLEKVPDNYYQINTSYIENGTIYLGEQYVQKGEEVDLSKIVTSVPDSGYMLSKITVTDEGGNPVELRTNKFEMPDKSVMLSATFVRKPSVTSESYKVKFNLQGPGSEPIEITVDEDGKIVKPEDPAREGYTFGGWFKDEACTQAWDFDNDTVSEDTTLYAKWIKNTPKKTKVVLLKAAASGKKAIKLSWNKVSGATKYVIYAAKCDTKLKKIATVKGNKYTFKKLKGKKLKAHKTYKFYVVAYTANGKVKSRTLHFITGNTNGKYANVKSIKAKKTKVTLKPGKTYKLGATYKMYKGKKHIKDVHGKALKYKSNCPGVATVTKNGVVKAVGQGTATIYIQDISGKYCKVKVTVE